MSIRSALILTALFYGLVANAGLRAEQSAETSPAAKQSAEPTPASEAIAASEDPQSVMAEAFVGLLLRDAGSPVVLLQHIDRHWQPGLIPMALETLHFLRASSVADQLKSTLEKNTGQTLGNDLDDWYHWLWKQPENRHPHYARFKSLLYRNIDPLFADYFDDERTSTVRLDEIRWGGVKQDGIPPLRGPKMIKASEAEYLADSDVVFALKYGDDARAYPKRILAWHEMFVDRIDGVDYAGVYCTLCGAVIMYETLHDGVGHQLGTSGFLYRSNKVMYDRQTQSLWNTTFGEPIVGPLVGKDIALKRNHVVTTTWGEWRRRHPETTVLSLDTGHQRNYDEGVAYNSYFSTDELMFTVPQTDDRLLNKDEILALQFPELSDSTVAIHEQFLADNPVYHHEVGPQAVVVLTDSSGANRVYESAGVRFADYDGDQSVSDETGNQWTVTEASLSSDDGKTLQRLAAHRAFWFGWVAVHPDTELVK